MTGWTRLGLLALCLPTLFHAPKEAAEAALHPHFQKRIQVELGREAASIDLRFQTAHCDAEKCAKLPVGGVWHLAGARFETTGPLVIGGAKVPAGSWNLVARKIAGDRFELVIAPLQKSGFETKLGEDAIGLQTQFETGAPKQEHLAIDLHPAEADGVVAIELIVRFDVQRAVARIAVP